MAGPRWGSLGQALRRLYDAQVLLQSYEEPGIRCDRCEPRCSFDHVRQEQLHAKDEQLYKIQVCIKKAQLGGRYRLPGGSRLPLRRSVRPVPTTCETPISSSLAPRHGTTDTSTMQVSQNERCVNPSFYGRSQCSCLSVTVS